LQTGYFGWLEQACDQHEALLIPPAQCSISVNWKSSGIIRRQPLMRHIRTAKTFGDQIEVISGLHAAKPS